MVSAMVSIDCWHASDGQDVSGVHKDTVLVDIWFFEIWLDPGVGDGELNTYPRVLLILNQGPAELILLLGPWLTWLTLIN